MLSKSDQIRALRERRFVEAQTVPSAIKRQIGVGIATAVNKAKPNLINTNAEYQAKWRAANPELNRQRAREGMRKKRTAEKANGSA